MLEQVCDRLDLVAASLSLRLGAEGLPIAHEPAAGMALAADRVARIEQRGDAHGLRRIGLTANEEQVVWFLLAHELRKDVRAMVAQLADGCTLDPTLETIRRIVYGDRPNEAAYQELSNDGLLLRLGILERTDSGGGDVHVSRRTWALSPRVRNWLLNPAVIAAPEQQTRHLAVAEATSDAIHSALTGAACVLLVAGGPGLGRRSLLIQSCQRRAIAVRTCDAKRVAGDLGQVRTHLRDLALECRLTGAVPLFCNLDLLDSERLAIVANEFADLIEGTILVTCGVQRPRVEWDRPVVVVEMGQPTHEQRATLWHEALGQGTAEDAARLATNYPLAPALIVRAADAARARAAGRAMDIQDVHAGIRAVLDDRIGAWARRVMVTQTWDDAVLPEDQVEQIVELMARVRGRHMVYETWGFGAKVGKGLGVSALFSGPPGTGKTMVAGLIARELGLELYQVDVSKVVSKWIGETEKNLAGLFDAAEAGHAILLFDEADSLFGKRTEVKSSNDRYANLETNYLLQRLESFTGVCLLTSNHESNIDPAFQRRLGLHLRFELPDAEERAKLWRAMMPASAPIAADIQFDELGRKFAMSGGYIKNAALRAAFVAADRGEVITHARLERAARVEYEGMGKIAA